MNRFVLKPLGQSRSRRLGASQKATAILLTFQQHSPSLNARERLGTHKTLGVGMWTIVGSTVDSATLRAMFGDIGRTRLHTLRQQGVIPAPDGPNSTPVRPQWRTESILEALPPEQRRWTIFEGFDTPEAEGQRWRFDQGSGDLLEIPVKDDEPPARVWRWRYEHVSMWHDMSGDHPAGEASLLVPLDGAGWHMLAPYRQLAAAAYEACGYGTHMAGTVLIMDTATSMGLMVAEIPRSVDAPIIVESVRSETVARLLGHALPMWPKGCATLETVAAWNPENQVPVPIEEPPSHKEWFALARRVRSFCKTLRATDADKELIKSFEDMDLDLQRVALGSIRVDTGESATYITSAVKLPEPPHEGYHGIGWIPAVEWLTTSDAAPEELARRATQHFGYISSMGVVKALAPENLTAENAIGLGLRPAEENSSWQWKILRETAGAAECAAYMWDLDNAGFPTMLLATPTHWYLHAPRSTIVELEDIDEMIISTDPAYGLAKTFDGAYLPLAIRPGSNAHAVAACLTAWARDGNYEVILGQNSPLVQVPAGLDRLLSTQKANHTTTYSVANLMALARTTS